MSGLKLQSLAHYKGFPGPLVLVIMDGIGLGPQNDSNGVWSAYTPTLDSLFQEPLFTKLRAHGTAVGLPSDEDMGNSEVGHNALGAGRVFAQGAKLVNEAIESGRIWQGEAWRTAIERAHSGGTIHFIGLLSDGNVHSHINHLLAMLDRCAEERVEQVRIHVLLDGRDVGEKSALTYIDRLEDKLRQLNSTPGRNFRIASGGGRMVTTMDRYGANWGVVELGWKAHVLGQSRPFSSAAEAVQTFYDEDPTMTDQYLESFVIVEHRKPVGPINNGDAVIFFNFRGDRAIEISRAFEEKNFTEFDRQRVPKVFYAGMMQYDGDAAIPKHFLVEPPAIDLTIAQYLCAAGVTSFAISETQKFGHVTYFWNGNNSGYVCEDLEKYVEIPSDKVTFDKRPWMKSADITDRAIQAIKSGDFKFVRMNYANGDMVGHTGNVTAIRIAVECVDLAIERLLPAIESTHGILAVTADHGNADCMYTEKNGVREPMVAHTLNPVPFVVKDFSGKDRWRLSKIPNAGLSNVTATLLNLLGLEKPEDYDHSLLQLE